MVRAWVAWVLAGSVLGATLADITCGDGKGAQNSDWFNKLKCGSFSEGVYGAACADDFNVWCCPRGFGCSGSFRDPGSNNHCQTKEAVSSDCTYCPDEVDSVLKVPIGTCLDAKRYGACPKVGVLTPGRWTLNATDFVIPHTQSGCRFYCCPAKGQYCVDEGCVSP